MTAATTTRSRTPDRVCAEAVEFARHAAVDAVGAAAVGEHLGLDVEGERVVTHYFATTERAYRGWRWAVTVTRAARAKQVTLDETVLLPGQDALIAPEWVPWSERLRPGDLGPGDLLPSEADDLRLEPGYSGDEEPAPNSVLAEDRLSGIAGEDVAIEPDGGRVQVAADVERAQIASVADELGMGRPRVLSRLGLNLAADRWEKEFGAHSPMAQAAPAACVSCGFMVPLGGSLSQAFGVCSNEFSPADGRIISLAYGCGAHSEAAVMPAPAVPAAPVLDEFSLEPLPLHPDRSGGSVEESTPAEELGHS
ncbi:DUF3027 domain-containing protein [Streptacidiphilus jiangxiensis]|uniref:DUF3027 domain-containing protein n=1 Tax=Streptacidiphilus jiangxiensis TaxID=235985 RepID=A0A1H7F398_STRJI|nr:DUF3027 domain-containing protein [Streptacidiphilus jiangxiensis]SEK20626.1 Protein of unknown function [Streptacidiphilus jiangxiensis]